MVYFDVHKILMFILKVPNIAFNKKKFRKIVYFFVEVQNYHIELLKIQSCKLHNKKYMTTSTQVTKIDVFAFIAVLDFNLLSRKVLFLTDKDNRNVKDCNGTQTQNHLVR